MRRRRGLDDERLLCSGPGRVCQALGITDALSGHRLDTPPFSLLLPPEKPDVAVGVRIGITRAMDYPWRYGVAGSRFLSKPIKPLEQSATVLASAAAAR